MDVRPGAFIVIEGVDGSGKGTQFRLLKTRLEEAGYRVATFDFPQYDSPSSYFVKEYLNGAYGSADEVGPYTGSLFYALDRYEASPHIRKALKEGKVVLCNRFTGSNMAHQGTKFRNAEERRGFFIWLDNLEFEMLQIPRPDISFVLRVPAEVSQTLLAQKGERSYTDKKLDIHESDRSHLERSVEVYDDLTQLFPKDFQRIDCVRGGKLLDVEDVQAMLWEKITPLLPRPAQLEMPMVAEPAAAAEKPAETQKAPAEEPAPIALEASSQDIVLESASQLLMQKLRRHGVVVMPEPAAEARFYTPLDLAPDVHDQYQAHMLRLVELQRQIYTKLVEHTKELRTGADGPSLQALHANAIATAVLALPVATTQSLRVSATPEALPKLLIDLLSDELPEVRAAGKAALAQTRLDNLHATDIAYRVATKTGTQKLAAEHLSENHTSADQPIVDLTYVWPRNELDLVTYMLYEYGHQPLRQLHEETTTWPYNRKLEVFDAYIGERTSLRQLPGSALEHATYQWDAHTAFSVLAELTALGATKKPIWQALSPRYGYEVPELVEAAGAADLFEECFDLSLQLYSTLQKAGHQLEAQYATLAGHRVGWQLRHDAREAFALHESATVSPYTHAALIQMHHRLSEVHPMLADYMKP